MSVSELKTYIIKNDFDYIFDAPMSDYTTFHIGGTADILAFPRSAIEIESLIIKAKEFDVPVCFIGNGSNILVRDGGIRGLVVRFGNNMASFSVDGTVINAGAGITMAQLARVAADYSLTGFEFASGIPGTLGGGITMNAGAYKGELKDVVVEATALDEDGSIRVFKGDELDFSYRHSVFSGSHMLILSARIQLKTGDKEAILARMKELAQKRRTTQPLEYPSAGSAFKRPDNGYAAAMIDGSGLKGFAVGGAQVSEKHAGFIVNRGRASATDVLQLIESIQKKVNKEYATLLEPEIVILGEDKKK